MALGFSFDGQCYETTADVLSAVKLKFPRVDGIHSQFLNSSSITAGPVLSYNLTTKNLETGLIYNYNNGLALPQNCELGVLTLHDVFAIPSAADMATTWGVGFIFPLLVGLVAWAISRVVKF